MADRRRRNEWSGQRNLLYREPSMWGVWVVIVLVVVVIGAVVAINLN